MDTTASDANLQAVHRFFDALERQDHGALGPLLDDDVVEVIPYAPSGDPQPFSEFRGKEAVLGYLSTIIENFSRTVLRDKRTSVADGGGTVFLEANGDLVRRGTSEPYTNVYVFKFVFRDGRILHVSEYANPVTFAKLMGMPIG